MEIRDFYAEDQNPAGSYYTPDSKSLGWTAQFERKLRELFPRAPPPDPPINPDFARTSPPPYDQSMAEGWDGGLGGDGLSNLENQAGIVGQNPNLQQQNVVTEGATPVTITATPANTQATTQTMTTEQFSDSTGAFASSFARQLAHEEEERRLSSIHQTNPRIKPFTVDERDWIKNIYNTVGEYADEQEMSMRMTPQNERMQQNANSPVGDNQRDNYVLPNIFLFKTTREDNGISPHNILPEEYNPLKSRIPNPISEPSGVLPVLDGETASKMLVKVSIMGIISKTRIISPENLINHLRGFTFRSRAINDEFLNRVQTQNVIIPEEAKNYPIIS